MPAGRFTYSAVPHRWRPLPMRPATRSPVARAVRGDGGVRDLAVGPQVREDRVADLVGDAVHLGRLGGVAEERVLLGRGLGAGVPERRLGPVLAALGAGPVVLERDRVGVVAGQRARRVLDQVVAVGVELRERLLDVALRVAGEVLEDLDGAAVDLVALPRLERGPLLVGVVPVAGVAGVVVERLAAEFLALRQPRTVGVERVAPELEVLEAHRDGQRDLVVVAEGALEIDRELVVVAGDVAVERVEPVLPGPVPGDLLDVLVGQIDPRHGVTPERVVLAELGVEGRVRVGVAVARVLRGRVGQLAGDRPQLDLEPDRLARVERDAPGQRVAGRGEAVTAEPGVERRQAVADRDVAAQLRAVGGGGRGDRRLGGDRPRRRRGPRVRDRQVRDRGVVVGDVLPLPHRESAARVERREVAGVLEPLGRRLGERRSRDSDRV